MADFLEEDFCQKSSSRESEVLFKRVRCSYFQICTYDRKWILNEVHHKTIRISLIDTYFLLACGYRRIRLITRDYGIQPS
jgi:uncharacterized protein with von Willebrand factor type A (vWA) domain